MCELVLNELCSSVGSLTNPNKLAKTLRSESHIATTTRTLAKHLGYFFGKIIIERGYGPLRPDDDGIFHVGVIPFLLDESILSGIIAEARFSPRKMV